MARLYVYSTLTNDMSYNTFAPKDKDSGHQVNEIVHSVLIKGGTNRADQVKLFTPRGVVTEVSESDYEHLQNNPMFKYHMDKGFITVRKSKVDPEVAAAADMEQRDGSAPHTPNSPQFDAVRKMDKKPSREDRVRDMVA